VYSFATCFHAGILRGLFDPENAGDMYFETSLDFQRTTWRYIPEVSILQNVIDLQFFCIPQRPDRLRDPPQLPMQWVLGTLPSGVKRLGRESDK
jgi:hypothetical protein